MEHLDDLLLHKTTWNALLHVYCDEMLHVFVNQLRRYWFILSSTGRSLPSWSPHIKTICIYSQTLGTQVHNFVPVYFCFVVIFLWTLYTCTCFCSVHGINTGYIRVLLMSLYALVLCGSSQTTILTKAITEKKHVFCIFYKQILKGSPAKSSPVHFASQKSFPLYFVH